MDQPQSPNEREIMIMMRKTLSAIIRDITPLPGMRSPLRDETVESVRHCLGAIAAREQEIARVEGRDISERPRYADEPVKSQVIDFKTVCLLGHRAGN